MLLLLLILPLATLEEEIDINYVTKYFERFGYYNISDHDTTDVSTVLMDFQEKYNLPVDGTLNDKTISLLRRPRCYVGENDYSKHSYTVKTKWGKTNLTWYFPQANRAHAYSDAAKKAFDIWQENSKFTFRQVRIPSPSPDITITIVSKKHQFRANCQGNHDCSYDFDGPGKVLAHAYFPSGDGCIEIHVDAEEHWNTNLDGITPDGESSFVMMLVHEIGHTLGLGHSDVHSAIMYPWYQINITTLDEDDKMALEALYGPTQKYVPNPFSPKRHPNLLPTHQTTTATSTPMYVPSICDIESPDFMFLAKAKSFPNFRLYVGHQSFVWKFDLKDIHIPLSVTYVDDYLPQELKSHQISNIFQNSAGNLFALNKASNTYYTVSFPDLNILETKKLPIPVNAVVDFIFQTNSGQIYVFYDKKEYVEFNDGFQHVMFRGSIRDQFELPEDISSAFRYTDGYIYFFTKESYYKYSEYTKNVVASGPFDWNIFGIPCPNTSLKEQLKNLLEKIISFYE